MIRAMVVLSMLGLSLTAHAGTRNEIDSYKVPGYCSGVSNKRLFAWQRLTGTKVVRILEDSHLKIPAAETMKDGCNTEFQPAEPPKDNPTVTTENFEEGTGAAS